MNLVNLGEYRSRKVVAALNDLLALAHGGHLHGLAFVAKLGPGDHRAGAIGDYQHHPEEALSATFRMERYLMRDQPPFEESGT